MRYAIVLAAGKGTRMKSSKNKVMHLLLQKPMIGHVIDHLEDLNLEKKIVVTGYGSQEIIDYLGDRVEYAHQDEQLGTGDAVSKVTQLVGKKGATLVLYGDCSLIQCSSLEEIYQKHEGYDLTLLTAVLTDPSRYNRVVRDNQGEIDRIVEGRDANEFETSINEVNLGVYCFNNELLFKYLPEIMNDSQEELNIIDLVEIMKRNNHRIQAIRVSDPQEFMGVNDRFELAKSNEWLKNKVNEQHMRNGVTILDPVSTFIGKDVVIEEDVTIYPNTHIYGDSVIKKGTMITGSSWIENAKIGFNCTIESSKVIDSVIGDSVRLGPYAHIRMNSEIKSGSRVGNFVEFKKTTFGPNSNCAHLTYLGDASVGEKTNIGCGVVTVNYDGKNKHRTVIDDGAFIGSNVNLIAPIHIGKNAVVAAGSTVDGDVAAGDLAIARNRQEIKKGYGEKYKSKKEKSES